MGHLHAQEAATIMTDMAGLDAALHYHLTANHYPPIPSSMIEPCKQAIELAANDEWDAMVALPDGISYRGSNEAPVHAMVEQHHLHAFVEASREPAPVYVDDDGYTLRDEDGNIVGMDS